MMNAVEIIRKLTDYGADMPGISDRFMDDMDFYAECFQMFLRDNAFQVLKRDMEQRNFSSAFASAHSLKGLSANMGLTPLYNAVSALVEALRAKEYERAQPLYEELLRQFAIAKALF